MAELPAGVTVADLHAYQDRQQRFWIMAELIRVRLKLGLTQTYVAGQMGTTQSAISDMERGDKDPSVKTLQRYARAVDVRLRMWVEPTEPELVEPPTDKAEGSDAEGTT